MNEQLTIKSLADLPCQETRKVEDYAANFGAAFALGLVAIKKAASLYAEAVRKFPKDAPRVFNERYPGVTSHTWTILERIGNNDLHPNALLLPYETARIIGHIPMERQERMFAEGVKGFNVVNRSTLVPHVVAISALTTPEAEILIDREKGTVRTVAQQRKLILSRRKEALGETVTDNLTRQEIPYRICGNVCVIGQHELSLGTLKGIVGEMEARLNRGRMPWRPDRKGTK